MTNHSVEISTLKAPDVGRRLGISRSYAHELIVGTKSPSLAMAARIEREFGVPVAAWVDRLPVAEPSGEAA